MAARVSRIIGSFASHDALVHPPHRYPGSSSFGGVSTGAGGAACYGLVVASRKNGKEHVVAYWEFSSKFSQEACDFLADRYASQGEKAEADCIRLGMPVDHESHVALVVLTEFLAHQSTPPSSSDTRP
jgi:hypothetical protein